MPDHDPEALLSAYAGADRGYHNLEHLEEVLEWVDHVPLSPLEKDLLSLALFYHDAVYVPQRDDNEQASAEWAVRDLTLSEFAPTNFDGEKLVELILDTRHIARPQSDLGRWMVDIDLSVLGAAPERFRRYELGVRHEYAWVPEALFRAKRKELLHHFLDRPRLYFTDFFHQRLDGPARANLQAAVEAL